VPASGSLEDTLPTATPFIYTVVANDTLFGIAASLNISLDALIAANPGLDPRSLSPGTQLVIPTGNQVALTTAFPTITPVETGPGAPLCYSSAANELRCFVLVTNFGDAPLESVTGVVQLFSEDGDVLATLEAVPPLNIIAPGARMPLVAYTDDAPAGWVSAQAQIFTAFSSEDYQDHYLDASADNFSFSLSDTALAAHVEGEARVNGTPAVVWVLGVAYDANENVVGVRRWESAGDTDFDFWVYSLGSPIASVELLIEARP
jgi:LysM repeat protein